MEKMEGGVVKTEHDYVELNKLKTSYGNLFKQYNQSVEKIRKELAKTHKIKDVNTIETIKRLIKEGVYILDKVRELSGLEPIAYEKKNFLPPVSIDVVVDEFFDSAKKVNTAKDAFNFLSISKKGKGTLVYNESKHLNFLEKVEKFETYLEFLTHYQG